MLESDRAQGAQVGLVLGRGAEAAPVRLALLDVGAEALVDEHGALLVAPLAAGQERLDADVLCGSVGFVERVTDNTLRFARFVGKGPHGRRRFGGRPGGEAPRPLASASCSGSLCLGSLRHPWL